MIPNFSVPTDPNPTSRRDHTTLVVSCPFLVFYIFDSRNDWILSADSSWGEGFSTGTMTESSSKGKAVFAGELVTR